MMTIVVKCYHLDCRWNGFSLDYGYCSKGMVILEIEKPYTHVYKCDSYEKREDKKEGGEK